MINLITINQSLVHEKPEELHNTLERGTALRGTQEAAMDRYNLCFFGQQIV